MAFVDELTFQARAGNGGNGVTRWLHLKGKEFSGPAGGNGGDGGDVYIKAVRDIGLLARYRGEKKFEADNGADGQSSTMHGKRGDDLVIDLPIGSVVRNNQTGEVYELLEEGEQKMILKGGRGGAGNAVFKSSVNRTPEESMPGAKGEFAELTVELRLFADAGFIGFPNAGKTSLLNALTNAGGKVGAYAFTTLDPNLGALYGFVLADIPGLIEGASEGKGLGFKFLRHIARTKFLLHCISLESENPMHEYEAVRKELAQFENGVLTTKPEIVLLTKSDMKERGEIEKIKKEFKEAGKEAYEVTILDDTSVKALQDMLVARLR